MKVVLASNNAKKLHELSTILSPIGWELIPQAQLNIDECDEPFHTFVENALAKARHAAKCSGLPALADDSGLCVDALNGAPGVYSARYAQIGNEPKSDEKNNAKLLADLKTHKNRAAHFVSVIVFVRHENDPEPIIAKGNWHGEIMENARGNKGFGYDPLFFLPELSCSSAELPEEEKNLRSHRGIALQKFLAEIQNRV